MRTWQQVIDEVLIDAPGVFGVAVTHLETGEAAGNLDDQPFQLASAFKIPILVTLMRDVEEGKLRLDQRVPLVWDERVPGSGILQELDAGAALTVKDLATLMTIVSDNYATDLILNLVGLENVNAHMHELGLAQIHLRHTCWQLLNHCVGMEEPAPSPAGFAEYERREETEDYEILLDVSQGSLENNVATPSDLNRLLVMIANKEILTPASCELMIDILRRQHYNTRLPYLLPPGTKVAHKTGTVNEVVNDAGIIYLPEDKGAIAIAVLSRGIKDKQAAELTIARVARAVYDVAMGSEDK
ncbi:serine hydrolase [Brevibacillus choshinensis]|uniref:Serine hydrolase n=1 Tax=Brevibacillus choshinensis TaxID=54911 RepID=A0ABX7FK72_BRECH|nr:serine hydrolase [Brevibacillus choshinensis]QRG66618.1 serine hydrolase [Brevibacillus choshinensis]